MFFQNVALRQPDIVFGKMDLFRADPRSEKINLLVGTYKNEFSHTEYFPSVLQVMEEFRPREAEYLSIDGNKELVDELGLLLLGQKSWLQEKSRIYGAQTIGGTSALRIGAEFLAQELSRTVFLPDLTWPNHVAIFSRSSFEIGTYSYYDRLHHRVNTDAFLGCLEKLPANSIVLLQASCHNPSGCDLSIDEWDLVAQIMSARKLFPFFDCAYQGLGDGLPEDAAAIRRFIEKGFECVVAYSCSKNFSLYRHRVGALFVATSHSTTQQIVGSQIKQIIRTQYSNPPAFGAEIVNQILSGPRRAQWEQDVKKARLRLNSLRLDLVDRLRIMKRPEYAALQKAKGMFLCLDIDRKQVQQLMQQFGIYVLDNGRINLSGLNPANMDYFTRALEVVL